MKYFLLQKWLVKDEWEIEVIWGPFTEIELKLLELEDPDQIEEVKF